MSGPLERVKNAAACRNHSSQRYVTAIQAAAAAGETLTAIAGAAGTTKQAVSQLLKRIQGA